MALAEKESTGKRKSPSQARSRKRVALILEATRELFKNSSLKGFTTKAVADLAGIPVSSVYQYFPNKTAILVEIYDTYLTDIRAVYRQFEDRGESGEPWEDVLVELFEALQRRERQDQIDGVLESAIYIYPELTEMERQHRQETAAIFAELLVRLGATWSLPKLRRLAQYVYFLYAGIWAYRGEVRPPAKELSAWEVKTLLTALSECFE